MSSDRRKIASKVLNVRRVDFKLLREVVGKARGKMVLKMLESTSVVKI